VKLGALFAISTALFVVDQYAIMVSLLLLSMLLYRSVGFSQRLYWEQFRPVKWFILFLFISQFWIIDWQTAGNACARLLLVIALANLLTMTTPTVLMISAIERGLAPLTRLGVGVHKISLAISLVLRFIPMLHQLMTEMQHAQYARGGHQVGRIKAAKTLLLPFIINTMRQADQIAEALEARGFRR